MSELKRTSSAACPDECRYDREAKHPTLVVTFDITTYVVESHVRTEPPALAEDEVMIVLGHSVRLRKTSNSHHTSMGRGDAIS